MSIPKSSYKQRPLTDYCYVGDILCLANGDHDDHGSSDFDVGDLFLGSVSNSAANTGYG